MCEARRGALLPRHDDKLAGKHIPNGINRYEEDGIEGLRDRPRPGRQPRVDAVTSARFKERIVAGAELQRDGVVAFRAVDAQRILKEEFEIDCALRSPVTTISVSWLPQREQTSRRGLRPL
jgi:transposase